MKTIDENKYEEQDNYPGGANENDWDDTETGEDATNQDEDELDDDELGNDAANQDDYPDTGITDDDDEVLTDDDEDPSANDIDGNGGYPDKLTR
jgi:hypothetical protein